MKKRMLIVCALLLCVILSGCRTRYPSAAADGAPWDESWDMLGSVLGVEEPGHGFTLLDNNAILTADDTYLATWASGESTAYVNADGDDTELYEAEIYLLLFGCKDAGNARAAVADWIARESDTYTVTETRTETYNGQAYTVLVYECGSDTNPYSRGVAAFGVFENYAVSAELACLEKYSGDEVAILADFLTGCHYSADAK